MSEGIEKVKATSRARLKKQRNKKHKDYRFVFIIAIALIIYSSVAADKESEKQSFQNDDETRLASILSSVEGAGEVETMITKSSGQIVGSAGDCRRRKQSDCQTSTSERNGKRTRSGLGHGERHEPQKLNL